jgi:site-specific DNA recombinase
MAAGAKASAAREPLVPAIGYVRVSMMREEAISPEVQQAAITDWARRNGRRITDWVIDLDKTGRNFKRRIMEAISRVETAGSGDPREIAVWKYSRFGRTRSGVAVNLERVEKAGGQLQSATEEVDARTATGKFTRGMLFEVAAFESDRSAETWREAFEYRVRQGLHPLGRARFGYLRLGRIPDELHPQHTRADIRDAAGERYVPDPVTAPVLAAAYRAYAGGQWAAPIAFELNAQGILTTRGRLWSGRTLTDYLDSGFGAGLLRIHDPACRCQSQSKCKRRIFVPGAHEALISDGEWQAYLGRRATAAHLPPRLRVPKYPVSGLLKCGHCSGAMTGTPETAGGARFRCSRQLRYHDCPGSPSVQVSVLLDVLYEEIAKISSDLNAQFAFTERQEALRDGQAVAERLTRELAAKDRALARLAIRRAEDEDGTLPEAAWEAGAKELREDRARLEAALKAAGRQVAAASADPVPFTGDVLAVVWARVPAPALNTMLKRVIRTVVVWRVGAGRRRDGKGRYVPAGDGHVRIEVIPVWAPDDDVKTI